MLMLTANSAIGFFGTKAASTDSLPNVFPEVAQRADFVLFSFAIVR